MIPSNDEPVREDELALNDEAAPGDEAAADESVEPEWVRRRRLAAVFGEVLPEQTSDDASGRGGKGDDWYRDQVPPHHG